MFNPDDLTEDQVQHVIDYALELYSIAASDSLYENNPAQYDRLLRLSRNDALEIICKLDSTTLSLDPEEVGEGEIMRVELFYSASEDVNSSLSVHFADIYVTLEGIEEKLGIVIWFPEEDQWF